MLTEYHCHILPGIDDGAGDTGQSVAMAEMMKAQGVERLIATPHFYAHREKGVEAFLEKRKAAYELIKDSLPFSEVHLGAEIAIEHGISELSGIEKLAVEGTRIILLELPYAPYARWMSEEIHNIATEYKLRVMLAHVHRYLEYYSKEEMETILSANAIMQINNEAFRSWKEKRLVKRIISGHECFAFGSDAHNTSTSKPNWDMLQKKAKTEDIARSDEMFEEYRTE